MLGRKQSIRLGEATFIGSDVGVPSGEFATIQQQQQQQQQMLSNVGSGTANQLDQLASLAASSGHTPVGNPLTGVTGTQSSAGVAWFNKTSVRHFMRICSVASLISVCANTSRTFSQYPTLMLITFIVDIVSGLVFTIEMVLKIYSRGLMRGPSPYARDRWCQFDATMVLFIWISILLQVSVFVV